MSFLANKIVLTSVQRDALSPVSESTLIFNSDEKELQIYMNDEWKVLANTEAVVSIVNAAVANIDLSLYQPIIGYAKIADIKPVNTHAGTFTANAWRTRDLTTVAPGSNIIGLSLSLNRITLPAGIYRIFVQAPVFAIQDHVSKLRDITNSVDLSIGSCSFNTPNISCGTSSYIREIFTLTDTTQIEIQHYCNYTRATFGFGIKNYASVSCVYTTVMLEKIG